MPEPRRPESAGPTDYEVLDASDTLDGDPETTRSAGG